MTISNQFPVLLNVDVSETDSTYEIEADINGFHAENVNVSTWQESLIIEMKSEHECGQSYYLGELEAETCRRIIPLGFKVSADSIKMKYSHGTLCIAVPKPRKASLADRHILFA